MELDQTRRLSMVLSDCRSLSRSTFPEGTRELPPTAYHLGMLGRGQDANKARLRPPLCG
jgi:hypothetical protein